MTDFLFNESDDFVDAETEAREDELGAEWGDPRRCPRHPGEVTSSPDGMFDAPCGRCEYEMDQECAERDQAAYEFSNPFVWQIEKVVAMQAEAARAHHDGIYIDDDVVF